MASNIFEGARRISKIIAAIWITGWVCAFFGYAYWVYENKCSNSLLTCGGRDQSFISYFLGDIDGGAYLLVIGFLLFIWGFTCATGYIVRGFKEIPKGEDKK